MVQSATNTFFEKSPCFENAQTRPPGTYSRNTLHREEWKIYISSRAKSPLHARGVKEAVGSGRAFDSNEQAPSLDIARTFIILSQLRTNRCMLIKPLSILAANLYNFSTSYSLTKRSEVSDLTESSVSLEINCINV